MALTPGDHQWCPGPHAPGPYVPPALVAPDLCEERWHDALWPCPVHGCSHCAVDSFAYVDPLDYEIPADVDPDSWTYWLLTTCYESYVEEDGCGMCAEILKRSRWAWFPGSECEETCAVAHCSVCLRCGKAGDVCRVCGLCAEHQEEGGANSCEVTRWSRTAREEVVVGYSHEFFDPATQRWSR